MGGERPAIKLSRRGGNLVLGLKARAGPAPAAGAGGPHGPPGVRGAADAGPEAARGGLAGLGASRYYPRREGAVPREGQWVRGTVRETKLAMIRGRRRVKTAQSRWPARSPPFAGMWDFPAPQIRGNRVHARGV